MIWAHGHDADAASTLPTGCGLRSPAERFEVAVSARSHSKAESDSICSCSASASCPRALPGTFIRASFPRLSTSCSGAIASAAIDDQARLISAGAASLLSPPERFR